MLNTFCRKLGLISHFNLLTRVACTVWKHLFSLRTNGRT